MQGKYENRENGPELRFTHLAPQVWEELGKLGRTGWVERGVKDPESVGDHTIASRKLVTDISQSLAEFSEKDKQDILDMLEVHDWAESVIGDQVIVIDDPEEKTRLKAEKFKIESEAMRKICEDVGPAGEELFNIWLRFEERKDPAALFAREVDLYQALEKAVEYQQRGENVVAHDFINYAEKDITHPILRQRIADLKKKL